MAAQETPTPNESLKAASETKDATAQLQQPAAEPKIPSRIYLVSYPKIVFLYPTAIAALVAAIYMAIAGSENTDRADTHIVSLIFLFILAINLVVLSFDFPRTTSLTLFFFFVAVGIGLWFMFYRRPDWLPVLGHLLAGLKPYANGSFYALITGFLVLVFLCVLVNVQFDYWEVRPNELLHHHGFLSDMERFSAPNLRIDKEINDVFEYALLRSGRLILHPSNERRAIVLDNVFFINRKEEELTRMFGALQVQLRTDSKT